MKLRCLLIDDEPPALKVLARYIDAIQGLDLASTCSNAIEALDTLHQQTVDVIFLDIQMPHLIGTDFLRNLSHPPKVIFVTAYREYAVEGFELDAVDYLVKPVSFERFFKAITTLNRMRGQETVAVSDKEVAKTAAFIYLKVDGHMRKIFVEEIAYLDSLKDYVKVFLVGGRFFLVKQSISAMENLLSEHQFMRLHRSYIVSFDKISAYNGASVHLRGQEIPIGRLYKQVVMDRLLERP